MTAGQARAVFGAFILLCAGIVTNAFFLQSSPEVVAKAKAKAARIAAQAELRRARRLSVDALDQRRARRRLEWRNGDRGRKSAGADGRGATGPSRTGNRMALLRQDAAKLPAGARSKFQDFDARARNVRAIQRELSARNYQPGLADGVAGLVTRAAIMAYEYDHNLPLTAEPNEGLLRQIVLGGSNAGGRARRAARLPSGGKPHAERVTRTVQQSLSGMGYLRGAADGVAGEDTARAIREFEMDNGLVPTGRVSGRLVAQLARLAGRGKQASTRK